ncbi:MAG: radical SAM protein [Butyrivibrio sp.]|nr:radical SAM protein [Butyrivibrio sp.]
MKEMKNKMMLDYLKGRCLDEKWANSNAPYRALRTVTEVMKCLPAFFGIVVLNKTYIRQIELVVTTKCSLRCQDCANLMQHYNKPYDIPVDDLIRSAKLFLSKVDKVYDFRLLGGEPFLYNDMDLLLKELIDSPKVKKITFFTNGTIIPSEKLAALLNNKKVRIWISNYNLPQQKLDAFSEYCRTNNIKCYIKTDSLQWGYVGEPEAHNRSSKNLKHQFEQCNNTCRSILNGKLFFCPREAHLDDLDYCKASGNEYLSLSDDMSSEDILRVIYRKQYLRACDYCNYGTSDMVPIPPGIQKKAEK